MKKNPAMTTPLFILVIYLLIIAERLVRNRIIETGGNRFLTVIILQILIFIIPSVVFFRIKGIGYSKKMNIRLFSPDKLGCVFLSVLVLASGTALIKLAQINLFHIENTEFSVFSSYFTGYENESVMAVAMALVVTPAICEELVFRTIVLTEYNSAGYGAPAASVVSVILFSMMTMNHRLLPVYLISGVVYCMITYATGSALPAFIAHFAFNAYLAFAEKYVYNALTNPANTVISIFSFGLVFLVSLVLMFADLERILKRSAFNGTPSPSYMLKKTDDDTPDIAATEADENVRRSGMSKNMKEITEAVVSPTLLLCILFFLIMIFGFSN